MTLSPSGAHVSGFGAPRERGAATVLRLLPHVHHPPARVALPWPGDEARAPYDPATRSASGGAFAHAPQPPATARALDARGYRVSLFGTAAAPAAGVTATPAPFLDAPAGEYDLVCETGGFVALDEAGRARYAAAAARALRPGGILFGAFPSRDAAALLTLLGARFDAARLEPNAPAGEDGWLEAVFVRR